MLAFSLGGEEKEVVRVETASRARADPEGWLQCEVYVSAGAFTGHYRASITADELSRFNASLAQLYQSLSGLAELSTMERQLELRLTGNGRGGIELDGEAQDHLGVKRNVLEFHLSLDQTHLARALGQFKEFNEWLNVDA